MTLLLPIALIALLLTCWFATAGNDRSQAIHLFLLGIMGTGAILMLIHADWWLLGCWAVLCANILRFPYPMQHQYRLASMVALYALYAVGSMVMTPELTVYCLMGLVGVGLCGVVAWWMDYWVMKHANYRDFLMVISMACSWALAVMETPYWFLALLVLGIPLIWHRGLGQAFGWDLVGLCALGLVYWPVLGAGLLVLGGIGAGIVGWPYRNVSNGPDHARVQNWYVLLSAWWLGGWKMRLLGVGPDTWIQWADSLTKMRTVKEGVAPKSMLTHPHNEYVSILFEHGLLGLLLFLGWLGSLCWQAWSMQPALLIPGLTLGAIAFTIFPWSFPREIARQGKTWIEYEPWGNMGMVMTSLVIAMLLGGAK